MDAVLRVGAQVGLALAHGALLGQQRSVSRTLSAKLNSGLGEDTLPRAQVRLEACAACLA